MKKNILIIKGLYRNKISFFFIILILLISLPMCKTISQEDEDQFTLSVVLGSGISGTPVDGVTLYSSGAVVNYNYQLEAGYQNLIVTLDGSQVASNGTITMDKDHNLNVSATAGNTTDFILTINVGTGVTGTPSSGTYTHSENETLSYSYQVSDGYRNLVVSLDGTQIADSGNITMDSDHSLTVTAEEGYDIRGEWDLELTVNDVTASASIQETINVSLEFSGSLTSGNVFINGTNVGSYTVQSEVVSFVYTITESILGQVKYDYSGEFKTNDIIGGDVVIYKITSVRSEVKTPMADILVKRGKWNGKRKKK